MKPPPDPRRRPRRIDWGNVIDTALTIAVVLVYVLGIALAAGINDHLGQPAHYQHSAGP